MTDLVFLAPNTREPFTTSKVLAECADVKHHAVQQMIQTHEQDFKSFGILAFEMRKLDGRGRPEKVYHLNEQQATLLMTYLRNTEVVRSFKMELVRQFYAMRQELHRVEAVKVERRRVRRNVTDAIAALPDSPHKHMKYAHFTNLAYLAAIGVTAREIREARGAAKNAVASDYMTAAELEAVADAENRIAVLIEAGIDYAQIKEALLRRRAASVPATTTNILQGGL